MRKVHELKIKCPLSKEGCEWTGELGDVQNHINPASGVCEYVMVQCDYNCGDQVERRALASHKADLCPRRPFVCQYCDYQAAFEEVKKHWLVCSKYPLECPNGCGAPAIERQHFKEHVEVCPLEVIVCSFHLTGCTVRLPRKDMSHHLSESQSTHLTLIPKVIVNMQQKLAEKDREIAQLQADMVRLTSSSLDKEKRIAELERRDSQQLVLQQNTVSKTDYTYPPVNLIVPNFSVHKYIEDQWFSEPFYTHAKGYKMCLSIFANGVGKGEDSHVSVFANLMRGDFDDSLGWPFRGDVVVQLEDDDQIIEKTLKFTARSPAKIAKRVVDGDRHEYGQGFPKYTAYSNLVFSSSVIFRVCSVDVHS